MQKYKESVNFFRGTENGVGRGARRFRAAERRRNVVNAIESAVTALIGVGFAVCVALTLTML